MGHPSGQAGESGEGLGRGPSANVSLLFTGTSVSGLLGIMEAVSRSRLPRLPNLPGRAPGAGQDACAACDGEGPEHSSVPELPDSWSGPASSSVPAPLHLPIRLSQGRGLRARVGFVGAPRSGSCLPPCPGQPHSRTGQGPWPPSQGQRAHIKVLPPILVPAGT